MSHPRWHRGRKDRCDAFQRAFGGTAHESRFDGWREVEGCRLHQLAELPLGLEAVSQLLHTTCAPRPRLVGGLGVAGGYLWVSGFEPVVRAPGAREVACNIGNGWLSCERASDGVDWTFPNALAVSPPATVEVRAVFETQLEETTLRREGTMSFRFVAGGHGVDYKAAGAGRYWREACTPEQLEHRGKTSVPLDISTPNADESADFLQLDPSLRYLGRGLGEISLSARPDHQWLVVGTRKNPRDVVFVGDLDAPLVPDGGESPDKGDRRTWSCAFNSRRARVTALVDGHYVPLEREPRLRAAYQLYQRRARRQLDVPGSRICAPSGFKTGAEETVARAAPSKRATQIAEAVAALGVARSGFPLREFQNLMARLTVADDFILWQQLIRAWTEAGLLDLLRRQDRSQTMVVPRPPRFVMVRRGPAVDATLVGLAPQGVTSAILALACSSTTWVSPTTELQPAMLRLLEVRPDHVADLSRRVGLRSPEWLRWGDPRAAPDHLLVRDDLRGLVHGTPPDAYCFDAQWDWQDMGFKTRPREGKAELVEVERRRHHRRCSIYVVLVDGEAMLWCYLRSWALLRAAELREEAPFSVSNNGIVRSLGISPMHLPLPLGRLCAVLGAGLPGPDLGTEQRVHAYRYPFGSRIHGLVQQVLPPSWIDERSRES